MVGRESVETWIIAEYVEGTVLSEVDDIKPYYAEMKAIINQLHWYGLSSNDIHAGNFVITKEGLKVIDLSDYGNFAICKANDLIALQRFYGIEPDSKNFVYRFIRFRDNFRHWSRKIRGRKLGSSSLCQVFITTKLPKKKVIDHNKTIDKAHLKIQG